ncbi:hypothetical protein JCM10450v2_000479 [Rhodotorula kratochvilovae]
MADPTVLDDVGRATGTLLGSTSAGSQVALILYGLYLAAHTRYTSSDLYARLAGRVKVVLWAVFALLTAYSALVFADVVYWSTTTQRTPSNILHGWPVDSVLPVLAGCVALPVQAVLSLRAAATVSSRTTRYVFIVTMLLLSLVSFAGAVGTCVTGFLFVNNKDASLTPREYEIAASAWLWTSAVVNIVITASLAWTINHRLAPQTEKESRMKLWSASAIQTAAYTAVLSFAAALTASAALGESSIYALLDWAFWLPLPACYGLSLYTTLAPRRAASSQYPPASTSGLPLTAIDTSGKAYPPLPEDSVTLDLPSASEPPSYATVAARDPNESTTPTTPTKSSHKPARHSALYDRIEPWERRASVDDTRIPMPTSAPNSAVKSSGGSSTAGRRGSSVDIHRAPPLTLNVAPSRLRTGSVSEVEGESSSDDDADGQEVRPKTDGALRSSQGFEHHH